MTKGIVAVVVFAVVLGGGYFLLNSQKTTSPSTSEVVKTQEETDSGTVEEAKENVEVVIENFSFSPKTIKVKAGGTVTWTNKDSIAHTATGDNGEFDTGLLGKDMSESVTFDTSGTFAYHCTPHPYMKASVVVE